MSVLGLFPLVAHGLAATGASLFGESPGQLRAIGWAGFLDQNFMLGSFASLALATVLGAVIGYHPSMRRTVDSLTEADMP
ncbi:MAG TPA: hypothetical protein VGI30_03615, partial [Caulobacteraceae bacterium]